MRSLARSFLILFVGLNVRVPEASSNPVTGQWSSVISWPLVAAHAILMGNGKVLVFSSGASARVWDPATGTFTSVPAGSNLFCAGHVNGADGKPVVIGGDSTAGASLGIRDVNIFNYQTQTWSPAGPMSFNRWYPTGTLLPDGKILAVSGSDACNGCLVQTPEIYDPALNTWTSMPTANANIEMYPFMFVLPDGRVVQAGASEYDTNTRVLDLNTKTWTTVDSRIIPGGSAVMYQPGKIMKSGAGADSGFTGPTSSRTHVLDMTQASPLWRETAPMAFFRGFHNLTLLPDGTVLATGGGTQKDGMNEANAVKPAEIWNPATETWTTMSAMATPRLYHSIGLLLPDGRVLVSGSGADPGVPDQLNAETFSPPYLFKGARPVINSAPATVLYGSAFSIATPDAAGIQSVSLIRPGAVTHSFNEDQRFMNLSFVQEPGGLNVSAPAGRNLAPPGTYLLFIVNSDGVPSIGSFVTIPVNSAPDTTPPSVPTGLVATPVSSTQIDLSWNPSTDDVGVVKYWVSRDGVNIATVTTGTSFSDTGLSPSTAYAYGVSARDAADNASAPATASATTPASAPPAQIALVQRASNNTAGAASLTAAFPSAVQAGNLIVASVSSWPNPPTGLTDTRGNTYALAGSVRQSVAGGGYTAIYYAKSVSAGANTVTYATSASGQKTIVIAEFSGIHQTSLLDAAAGASGTSNAPSSGNLTPTVSGDLLIGAGSHDVTTVTNAGAGFTMVAIAMEDSSSHQPLAMEYRVLSDVTPQAANFSLAASVPWAQNGALFKAATQPDAIFPTVSITAPSNGATVSGTAVISATASDNVGVAGVQFKLDGSNLGAEVTFPPYSVSWDTTLSTNGAHVLSATARDAAGNQTPSANVSVTVNNPPASDTTPPLAAITFPANGATVTGIVTVSATASDNAGVVGVQFMVDGVIFGPEDLSAPYSVSWNTTPYPDGAHLVTAVARDAAGNQTTASTATVTVFNTLPAAAITASPDAIFTGQSSVLSWTASNADSISIDQGIGAVAASGSQSVSPVVTTTYTLTATNFAGSVISRATVTVSPPPDTTPPSIPAGLSATAVSPAQINLSWNASSDNVGVTGYWVYRGGLHIATVTVTSFQDTGLIPSTAYTYTVAAKDASGNVSGLSAPAIATTPAQPPAAITLVQNASNNTSSAVSLAASFPSAVQSGNLIVAAVSSWPNAPTGVTDSRGNTYTLAGSVRQTTSGGSWTAMYYAKTLSGGADTVTASAPGANGQISIVIAEFSGVAQTSFLDGTAGAIGSGATPSSGNMTPTASGDLVIGAGTHDVTTVTSAGPGFTMIAVATEDTSSHQPLAMEYQVLSGVSPVSANFSLAASAPWTQNGALFKPGAPPPPDTTLPTVAITSPTDGATVTNTLTISGTAADNAGLSKVEVSTNTSPFKLAAGTNLWTYNLNTRDMPNGSYTLNARATDAGGNVQTVSIGIVVQNNPNLASNPGFESGTTGWSFPTGTAIDASTQPHSGINTARVLRTANGTTSISNNPRIAVSANTRYSAEAWVKCSGVLSGQGVRVLLEYFNSAGASLGSRTLLTGLLGTSGWIKVSSTTTSPATTASARFLLQLSNSRGTAWFDDGVLSATPAGGFGAPGFLSSIEELNPVDPDTDDGLSAAPQKSAASDLSGVRAYPNPYRPGSGGNFDASGITFSGLTAEAKILIFSVLGERVAVLDVTGSNGTAFWDARNSNGEQVASGVYIYRVTNPGGERITGRVAVLR